MLGFASPVVLGVGVAAAREIVADADRGLWRPSGIVTKDLELSNECGSFGGEGEIRADLPL